MFKFFCDFDNTITTVDCTDSILKQFAAKKWLFYEEEYQNKKITAKQCLQKQISLIQTSKEELTEFILSQIELTEGFLSFVEFCHKLNYSLVIVSDGLDFVIKLVLQKHKLNIPFYSNHLQINNGKFKLLFPYYSKSCKVGLGNCKCSIINSLKGQSKLIYIGDGTSDYCPAQNIADYIIAKDKLAHFCRQNSIKHISFKNFIDVIKIIQSI